MSRQRHQFKFKKISEEDVESSEQIESDTDDDDDDDKYETDESSFFCFSWNSRTLNYVLLGLLVISCLSFMSERDMRMKLVSFTLNDNLPIRNDQLKSPLDECLECPKCADVETPIMPADFESLYISWSTRYDRLINQVQLMSRVLLKIKYGDPPYYVQLSINVDNKEKVNMDGELVFELSAYEDLPYSTYFFLSQVSAGAWNTCSFFISLGVVYLGDARGPDPSLDENRCDRARFRSPEIINEGIEELLAFQEYSTLSQHEPNTLGISGRPGGLGIYINAQV
jgi:hypothetical protein